MNAMVSEVRRVGRLDTSDMRRRALEALQRARFAVRVVAVPGELGVYTLTEDLRRVSGAGAAPVGFGSADAERYAAAINNEAALARDLLFVLSEFDRLADENERLSESPQSGLRITGRRDE